MGWQWLLQGRRYVQAHEASLTDAVYTVRTWLVCSLTALAVVLHALASLLGR